MHNKKAIDQILMRYENGLDDIQSTVKKLYTFWPNEYLTEELHFQWPELQEQLELYMSCLCHEL